MTRPTPQTPRPTGDAGSIVLGWLTKLTLVLGGLGLIAFDAISVGTAHLSAADKASTAARAASEVCVSTKGNVQKSYDAAYAVALESNDVIDTEGFSCVADGGVRLTYRREAATLLMSKIGPLEKYTVVTATGEASRPR